ncbi:hypothetical protein [Streptomyces sp. Tu102]|uniref:hypothetical protein n=1 Tax=Streptomyces sp. Tu102 TaxID=2838019 RepID=UPI001BDCB602|nr:hypothetical protein [Streptomyces sp. Tu102]MBT1095740.1 hypothetical protein [Streptomyces sp. Tu102]
MNHNPETRQDDSERTVHLRASIYRYRLMKGHDRYFAAVVWSALGYQQAPPAGHGYPRHAG